MTAVLIIGGVLILAFNVGLGLRILWLERRRKR